MPIHMNLHYVIEKLRRERNAVDEAIIALVKISEEMGRKGIGARDVQVHGNEQPLSPEVRRAIAPSRRRTRLRHPSGESAFRET